MVQTWMRWCRICAHEDVDNPGSNSGSYDSTHLFESLNKYLSQQISSGYNLPQYVCIPCEQQITSLISFIEHASTVQAMFLELVQNSDRVNVNEIRCKFLNEASSAEQQESKENIIQPLSEQLMDDIKPMLDDLENPIKIKEELCDDECMNEKDADDCKSKNSSEESSKEGSVQECAPFFCSECCRFYTQFHSFRNHMQAKHNKSVSPVNFRCTVCDEEQTTLLQLKRHMVKHIPQDPVPCEHCDEKFSSVGLLRDHTRKKHRKREVKQHICEECGRRCRNAITFEEHKLTHKGGVYNCSTCDKTFRTKYSLKVHEDTHSSSYVCQICGLQLNTKRTLYMHKLVHSDKRVHKCNYCGKEYKRSKTFKAHLICHTDLMPYKCNFCGRYFKSGSNCRTHIKSVHPDELAEAEASGLKPTTSNIPTLKELRMANSTLIEDTAFSDHTLSDGGSNVEV